MDMLTILVFCCAVVLGSYVQAATGFAMGLVVLAIVAGSRSVDIVTITVVISLLALLNVAFALRGQTAHVERRCWLLLCAGQLPAIWVGLTLLEILAQGAVRLLELILGAFVIAGSLSMLLRPEAQRQLSPAWAWVAGGAAGGVLGGLFSASGPVMGWFAYRQPLAAEAVRATLLACFAVTTTTRTALVAVDGGLTRDVWAFVALAVPLVLLGTWAGRRFRPQSDAGLRRSAFVLLLLIGLWIFFRSVRSLS
jgi:uncharacterized membrane protein YfcA